MPNTVLVGAQWGDEGKGKIIDFLTEDVDVVVRYQGGSNAGHTVKVGAEKYVLHLVPSGILHPGKSCVIGNGVVVDTVALVSELEGLKERGIDPSGRFVVGERAHVVLPFHGAIDSARDALRKGGKLGTTKRGIGPSYSDKSSRVGFRMIDLIDPDFPAMLADRVDEANSVLGGLGGDPVDYVEILGQCQAATEYLSPFIADSVAMLQAAMGEGKSLLFEGAQGTMLDIDFGTYPFVTSSNSTAGGACTGTGVAPNKIDRVIGVIKAYTTRVGEGPFPTELFDETGKTLAREGHEFGATTGRPRRCGWFDAVVARYSAMINGFDFWVITKLDVLDTLDTIKICTAYEYEGRKYETVPASAKVLAGCQPIYEEMPGWKTPTTQVERYEDLPQNARDYVARLVEVTGVPLGILSVGPDRKSTLRVAI